MKSEGPDSNRRISGLYKNCSLEFNPLLGVETLALAAWLPSHKFNQLNPFYKYFLLSYLIIVEKAIITFVLLANQVIIIQ